MAGTGFRRALTAAVLACVTLPASTVATPAAHAAGKPWGPIRAMSGGVVLASADGDFANNGGVYATVGANWQDVNTRDGWSAYVKAEFTFWRQGRWQDGATYESERTRASASGPLSRRLRPDATAVRVAIKVCVDRSTRPDVCSPASIVTFNY